MKNSFNPDYREQNQQKLSPFIHRMTEEKKKEKITVYKILYINSVSI